MSPLTWDVITIRILISCIMGGLIGFEREYNNRPAGIRTHLLVCIGATIVALIQVSIMNYALQLALDYPDQSGVIRSDPARLICQVISGIGFLGAGTIVVTKNSIRGLTTAASLWATAALGIAVGMGYLLLAVIGFVVILLVLTLLKRVLYIRSRKRIQIKYAHRSETSEFILHYFAQNGIRVRDSDFSLSVNGDSRIYTNTYTIELPKGMTYSQIAEDLCVNKNISYINLMNI